MIAKLCKETKMPKFGTKKALLGTFVQECLISVFSARIFKKAIVIFEISTLKFSYLQNFTKKQKCLNLGPKMLDLGIFGLEIENSFVIFNISTLEFV